MILADGFELLAVRGVGKATLRKIRKVVGSGILDRNAKQQAQFLKIPYSTIQVTKAGKDLWYSEKQGKPVVPELVALEHFHIEGWLGANDEGHIVKDVIVDAGFFDLLKEYALASCRQKVHENLGSVLRDESYGALYKCLKANLMIEYGTSAHVRHIQVYYELRKQRPDILLSAIRSANEVTIRRALRSMFRYDRCAEMQTKPFADDMIIGMWKALTCEQRTGIAARCFNNIGYIGWPDLTLIRDGKLKFVEVKTTDRLHASQVHTYLNVAIPLGLDFEIVQLCPDR